MQTVFVMVFAAEIVMVFAAEIFIAVLSTLSAVSFPSIFVCDGAHTKNNFVWFW